jgi:hypothetical protein
MALKILSEHIVAEPADEYCGAAERFTLVISGVSFCDDEVTFNPPLEVDGYREDGSDRVSYYYDFGMSEEFAMSKLAFWDKPNMTWTDRLKNLVNFDLEHAFFHTSMDPNYGPTHYALLGCLCLKGRTTLSREGEAMVKMEWVP